MGSDRKADCLSSSVILILQSYLVSGGKVTIDEGGLDAKESEHLTILTRALGLYGPLYAKDLQLVVGSYQMDVATNKSIAVDAFNDLDSAIKASREGDREKSNLYAVKAAMIAANAIYSGRDPQASQTRTGEGADAVT